MDDDKTFKYHIANLIKNRVCLNGNHSSTLCLSRFLKSGPPGGPPEANHGPRAFGLKFLTLCLLCYVLLEFPFSRIYDPINEINAQTVRVLMLSMGYSPLINGAVLTAKGFSIKVVGECSAVFLYVLYLSFIIAFPSPLKSKLLGLFIGIPVIALVNIFRIVLIFLAGIHTPELFDFLHMYLAQIVMISLVFCLCMAWVNGLNTFNSPLVSLRFTGTVILLSVVPFIIWLWLNKPYALANYHLVRLLLSFFGLSVRIPESLSIYPDTFITLNLVVTSALVLYPFLGMWGIRDASTTLSFKRKVRYMVYGFGITMVSNFLFFLAIFLFFQLKKPVLIYTINALLMINEWVVPFGIWLILYSADLFKVTIQK